MVLNSSSSVGSQFSTFRGSIAVRILHRPFGKRMPRWGGASIVVHWLTPGFFLRVQKLYWSHISHVLSGQNHEFRSSVDGENRTIGGGWPRGGVWTAGGPKLGEECVTTIIDVGGDMIVSDG